MNPTHRRRILQVIAVSLLAGCAAINDARETLEQVLALQQKLQVELPGETIRVTESSNGQLSVDLVNSRLASLPAEEKATRTRQIAAFVRKHYARVGGIQTIAIVFKSEAGAAGFTMSSSETTNYAIGDLEPAGAPSVDSSARAGNAAGVSVAPSAVPDTAANAGAAQGIRSISRWKS